MNIGRGSGSSSLQVKESGVDKWLVVVLLTWLVFLVVNSMFFVFYVRLFEFDEAKERERERRFIAAETKELLWEMVHFSRAAATRQQMLLGGSSNPESKLQARLRRLGTTQLRSRQRRQ